MDRGLERSSGSSVVLRRRSRHLHQCVHGDYPIGPGNAGELGQSLPRPGTAYAAKGQLDRAIEDYEQASRFNPNFAEAFGNRALCTTVCTNTTAPLGYDHAIRLDPNFAEAFYGRGTTYAAKNQYDRAIEDYDQATRLNPNVARRINSLYGAAFLDRGLAFAREGQADRAIEYYEQAIRLDPTLESFATVPNAIARQSPDKTASINIPPINPSSLALLSSLLPRLSIAGAPATSPRANPIGRLRTSIRRSGLIRTSPRPTATAAARTMARANMTAPLRTTTRPSA